MISIQISLLPKWVGRYMRIFSKIPVVLRVWNFLGLQDPTYEKSLYHQSHKNTSQLFQIWVDCSTRVNGL